MRRLTGKSFKEPLFIQESAIYSAEIPYMLTKSDFYQLKNLNCLRDSIRIMLWGVFIGYFIDYLLVGVIDFLRGYDIIFNINFMIKSAEFWAFVSIAVLIFISYKVKLKKKGSAVLISAIDDHFEGQSPIILTGEAKESDDE